MKSVVTSPSGHVEYSSAMMGTVAKRIPADDVALFDVLSGVIHLTI